MANFGEIGINSVKIFVKREYNIVDIEEEKKKIEEILIGYIEYKKIKETSFVILQLPEGSYGAIDQRGVLYDLDEIECRFN